MASVEILGRVNEEGRLEVEQFIHLPPGEVRITIESVDIEADEALWDEQFAKSQDILEQLSLEAHEDYLAGRTEDCDDSDEV